MSKKITEKELKELKTSFKKFVEWYDYMLNTGNMPPEDLNMEKYLHMSLKYLQDVIDQTNAFNNRNVRTINQEAMQEAVFNFLTLNKKYYDEYCQESVLHDMSMTEFIEKYYLEEFKGYCILHRYV